MTFSSSLRQLVLTLLSLLPLSVAAQTDTDLLQQAANSYFSQYERTDYRPSRAFSLDSVRIDSAERRLYFFPNEAFCSQVFTETSVKEIYQALSLYVPAGYSRFKTWICDKRERPIETFIPNFLRTENRDATRIWTARNATAPWVKNVSRPYEITDGLSDRHLFIWPSHGRYYKEAERAWAWQRPFLFCTTEDLFTQSIVVPFLFPMLEKAGAIVASPRERDVQTQEAVVDNDASFGGVYLENNTSSASWSNAPFPGFAPDAYGMNNYSLPFSAGTARSIASVTRPSATTTATWTPDIPETGDYAVYISYQTVANSIDDARYTVRHLGGSTEFRVNQQIGGGTWVYLGTFRFAKGMNEAGKVILSNLSKHHGTVTADAVRFGGGMGQTQRGEAGTSRLPRHLEAARYYAQFAGVPDSLWNKDAGTNDYNDDLRARGNMLNWLAGGSAYLPGVGKGVPFELSLAVHSDAGVQRDNSIHGTLGIFTTVDGRSQANFPEGMSRLASSDYGSLLLTTIQSGLNHRFGKPWNIRERWDRNYAETRIPDVPSAILEILSHQNFADMRLGHDPLFKFALARAIYKATLKFVASQHKQNSVTVQPLPVRQFAAALTPTGVHLSWLPQTDSLEPSALPTSYVLYTRIGNGAFDNGRIISRPQADLTLPKGIRYGFRVTALNRGGESFPSEILSVYRSPKEAKKVLIVNGFDRLSGPAVVETADSLGFDLDADYGVPYLYTTAFSGRQRNFNRWAMGIEGSGGLGYSGYELQGERLAGNTFDYPALHGSAIEAAEEYSYASCSHEAFAAGDVNASEYAVIDYIAGFQKDAPYNLRSFPAFSSAVQTALRGYVRQGGRLFVSGSFIGSGLRGTSGRSFVADVLRLHSSGTLEAFPDSLASAADSIQGLGIRFNIYRTPNEHQIAATHPDILEPAHAQAFPAFAYANGRNAGVAYAGSDFRVLSMGFPFETICQPFVREQAMRAILEFLTK